MYLNFCLFTVRVNPFIIPLLPLFYTQRVMTMFIKVPIIYSKKHSNKSLNRKSKGNPIADHD